MTTQILATLDKFGLGQTCSRVLIHLLEKGPQSAGMIAKFLDVKRPTIYSALAELSNHGLISREERGRVAIFVAVAPGKIPGLLVRNAQKNLDSLKGISHQLSEMLEHLPNHSLASLSGFQVEVIDTMNTYDRAVLDTLLQEEFLAIWNPSKAFFRSSWRKDTLAFLEYTSVHKRRIREILTDGDECRWYLSQIRNENHHVKVVNGDESVMSDLVIGRDAIIISFNDPISPGAIKLKSPLLRPFFAELFERVWAFA